jgi:hypothetical protein
MSLFLEHQRRLEEMGASNMPAMDRAAINQALAEIVELRKALFMAAAHCQGGNGNSGFVIARLLGVPHPVRMDALKERAEREGLDPDQLWPWLKPMQAARAAVGEGK